MADQQALDALNQKYEYSDVAPPQPDTADLTKLQDRYEYTDMPANAPQQDTGIVTGDDTADAFETWLDANESKSKDVSWSDWVGQVGRSATLGVMDPLAAAVAYTKLKRDHPNLTYKDTLRMTRGILNDEQTLSADVVGALVPVAGSAKLTKFGAELLGNAATRSGLVDGATRWAVKHPKMNWLGRAAAVGGTAGATEEGIRASVNEVIDGVAGDELSPTDVLRAAGVGALMGAAGGPVGQGAVKGAGGVAQWVKATFNLGDAQTMQASGRFVKALQRAYGKPADEAVDAFQADVASYKAMNGGRTPAAAEVLPNEIVEDLADTISYYQGLDIPARQMASDITKRAQQNLADAGRGGARLMTPEEIHSAANRSFEDLGRRFGATPVEVSEDALDVLSRNSGWLNSQAGPAAKAIKDVVDARAKIGDMRTKSRRLAQKVDITSARAEVDDLRVQLAEMISEREALAEVPASETASLKVLINLRDALARHLSSSAAAGEAAFDQQSFKTLLSGAERILADYETNGLKVPLRSANHLRSRASAAMNGAYRQGRVAEGDTLRELNEALMTVGTKEVPEYGRVRQDYADAMVRMEAQDAGKAAIRDTKTPEAIHTWVREGLTPEGRQVSQRQLGTLRKGAEEGAGVEVVSAARGTPAETKAAAKKLTESESARMSLEIVSPARARRILDTAEQSVRSMEAAEKIGVPKSPKSVKEERSAARDLIETGFLFKLGGVATAGLLTDALMRARIPRGTARGLVEMLGDPAAMDKALSYMQRKNVDLRAFFGAFAGASQGMEVE